MIAYLHNDVGLGAGLAGVAGQHLPVVEHALREGLAAGVGAQVGREAERLVDGQVRLHHEHGRARHLRLLEHVPAPSVQHAVDAAHRHLGALQPTDRSIHTHSIDVNTDQSGSSRPHHHISRRMSTCEHRRPYIIELQIQFLYSYSKIYISY